MRFMDLTGRVFGAWTVVELAEVSKLNRVQWLCKCACGTERVVRGNDLRRGKSKGCGCTKGEHFHRRAAKDLVGKKFGRWTILKIDGHIGEKLACLARCE